MKRIFTASHHSFIDVSRVDDDLYGAMIEIAYQNPEVGKSEHFCLSQRAAKELIETLQVALIWLEPQPYEKKHPKPGAEDSV